MPAPKLPVWMERPSKNTLHIYLKEDVSSDYVANMFRRACADHGLTVLPSEFNNIFKAELSDYNHSGKELKMELSFRCGSHPTKGNMMAIEYDTYLAQNIMKGIGIAALVLVSVIAIVLIAGAAKGDGGGGGHGGGHHHCHSSSVFIHAPSHIRTRRRRRQRRYNRAVVVGHYMYTPTVHRTYTFNAVQQPITTQVRTAHEFKSRDEFFDMFFQNVANFMWNAGLVRVPDEAVLAASRRNATPLSLGQTVEKTVPMLGVKMFCFAVPDQAHMPGVTESTLRVDVVADARVVVRLKHGSPPSRFTFKTAVGNDLGNHTFAVAVGPTTKPQIQPGVWFAGVYAPSGANIKIGGLVFDDTDKHHRNLKLLGNAATSRTVKDDGGDEWEFVEDAYGPTAVATAGGGGGAAAAAGGGGGGGGGSGAAAASAPTLRTDSEFEAAAAALEAEHVVETLTQATDLLTLDVQMLADQIGLRAGAPPPPGLAKMDLAAMLFPLLPAPPFVAPGSVSNGGAAAAAGQAYDDDGDFAGDDEVLEEGEHPDAFTCPITLELMTDPVYTADGHTYDRTSITEWLKSNTISPMTGLDLPHNSLFPNVALQAVIVQYNASVKTGNGTVAAAALATASSPSVRQQPQRFDPMTGKPL